MTSSKLLDHPSCHRNIAISMLGQHCLLQTKKPVENQEICRQPHLEHGWHLQVAVGCMSSGQLLAGRRSVAALRLSRWHIIADTRAAGKGRPLWDRLPCSPCCGICSMTPGLAPMPEPRAADADADELPASCFCCCRSICFRDVSSCLTGFGKEVPAPSPNSMALAVARMFST